MPLEALLERGWTCFFTDRWEEEFRDRFEVFCFQRNAGGQIPEIFFRLLDDGKRVLYDMDDHLLFLERSHPTYTSYMYDPVGWQQLQMMRHASGLTLSTARLVEDFGFLNPRRYLLPNRVRLCDWEHLPHLAFPERFVVAWAGSATHRDSLALLKRVLPAFCQAVPEALCLFMGMEPPFDLPPEQCSVFPFGTYRSFQTVLASAQVVLAPLAPTPFNAAKSNLRILEAAAAVKPVIASDFGEYRVAEAAGGYLCQSDEDWLAALFELYANPGERMARANAAWEWVQGCDITKTIGEWEYALLGPA